MLRTLDHTKGASLSIVERVLGSSMTCMIAALREMTDMTTVGFTSIYLARSNRLIAVATGT